MKFQVSVIIPVYNAEAYLRHAVQSALAHDCVKEVILIEDKSPDNALSICKELVKEDQRVKLFLHPNNENRGAGASRNLGLKNATSDFVSFLDADDWYEPNRFDAESVILRNPEIDGVYGASGCFNVYNNSFSDELVTFNNKVSPDDLLYEIVRSQGGRFDTN
jgi:glycosyltransferase involved in cell wall biosynthesis